MSLRSGGRLPTAIFPFPLRLRDPFALTLEHQLALKLSDRNQFIMSLLVAVVLSGLKLSIRSPTPFASSGSTARARASFEAAMHDHIPSVVLFFSAPFWETGGECC